LRPKTTRETILKFRNILLSFLFSHENLVFWARSEACGSAEIN
jgi:hypothetical protein